MHTRKITALVLALLLGTLLLSAIAISGIVNHWFDAAPPVSGYGQDCGYRTASALGLVHVYANDCQSSSVRTLLQQVEKGTVGSPNDIWSCTFNVASTSPSPAGNPVIGTCTNTAQGQNEFVKFIRD